MLFSNKINSSVCTQKKAIINKCIPIFLLLILFTMLMNPLILAMTYKERGKQKIYDTMDEIQQKTTNILDVLHNIADWEKVNIKPTYSSVYYYPFFPYFVFRKTPPRAEYTILVRQGACEEHARARAA